MDDYVKREVRMLGIAGSLRRESLNRRLLEAMAELAPPGVVVDIFDALDTVPLFNEDLESPAAPAAVERLRAAVAASDGLLLATPEYNQSLPGVMKNSIDWLKTYRLEFVWSINRVAYLLSIPHSARWCVLLPKGCLISLCMTLCRNLVDWPQVESRS